MSAPPARQVLTLRDRNRLGIGEASLPAKFRFDVRSRHLRGSGSAPRTAASGSMRAVVRKVPPPAISGTFVSAPRYRQPRIGGSGGGADGPGRAGRSLDLAEGRAGAGRRKARADPAGFALLKFYARAGLFP